MPVIYQSSVGRTRGFCGKCGTPMFYETEHSPNERHFYAALLDHPENVEPSTHSHVDEMLSWIQLADELPHRR